MTKNCGHCGREIDTERWIQCPFCGYYNHFKRNKKGRLKKHICHSPRSSKNNLYHHLRRD